MSRYLSKSDFKTCFDCRTKLFYRKNAYPSNLDENEYLQFLADGGFMVEFIAKAQFPAGVDLVDERDPAQAFARTKALVAAQADSVVFEAAVIAGKFYARIDILRRAGKTLHLIEVKSSSLRSDEQNDTDDTTSPFVSVRGPNQGRVNAKWHPYLIDVAFQTRALRAAFPGFTVKPWLWVVDKAHVAQASETMARFRVARASGNPKARPEVVYDGARDELRGSKLLLARDVSAEVASLLPEVDEQAEGLAKLIAADGKVVRLQESVADFYQVCRQCEYRLRGVGVGGKNGFAECWGDQAGATPHILDLHRVSQIGSGSFPDPVPGLLAERKASLLDLQEDQLGPAGTRRERRLLQWTHSQDGGSEYLPTALSRELRGHQTDPGWPLHFIDFEACDIALPHHVGLRPYERVAFQWSCHTIARKQDETRPLPHAEWLNTERDFPNFKFARALREQIGNEGTVYVWSPYEQTTLRRVLSQIEEWVQRDRGEALRVSGCKNVAELEALAAWLDRLLGPEDAKGKRHSPRIRDLHDLALRHYFHPAMGGRTSIKVVLPAVWGSSAALRRHPWFADYLKIDAKGHPLDPYKTLPALPLGDAAGEEEAVVEGTGAIRVYQDLIFRQEADPRFRANREQLLKQYCRLDTAAMAMIWQHWVS
jgi:hypothetical protein